MLFFQTVLLLSYLYAHWSIAQVRRAAPGRAAPGARRRGAVPAADRHARRLDAARPTGSPVPWLLLTMLGDRRPALLRGLGDRAAAPELARRHRPPRRPRSVLPLPRQQHRQRGRPARATRCWSSRGSRSTARAGCGRPATGCSMLLLVACALVLWRSRRPRPEPSSRSRPLPGRSRRGGGCAGWCSRSCPSSLMLAVTANLTTNLAPAPAAVGAAAGALPAVVRRWSSRAARAPGPSTASRCCAGAGRRSSWSAA